MGAVPDAPAVVLVAVTLAAVLLLVEVALPTFGLAGLSALALGALAVAGAAQGDHPWWPLLLVAAAVCLWAMLLAARRAPPAARATATALFGTGSIVYGVLAADPPTVVLAAAATVALPVAFRPLLGATTRLLDLPPQLGMEALVGRPGTVVRWAARAGTVRVDGSLWTARSPVALSVGDEVVVVGSTGMTVEVAPRAPVP